MWVSGLHTEHPQGALEGALVAESEVDKVLSGLNSGREDVETCIWTNEADQLLISY